MPRKLIHTDHHAYHLAYNRAYRAKHRDYYRSLINRSADESSLSKTFAVRTYSEIGKLLSLSTERVRQLEVSALRKLRKLLSNYQSDLKQ